uniref:Uncharacterized protein n=1 Tax=Setaria italica TaxID=4555 RepID=K3YF30_SETIT
MAFPTASWKFLNHSGPICTTNIIFVLVKLLQVFSKLKHALITLSTYR